MKFKLINLLLLLPWLVTAAPVTNRISDLPATPPITTGSLFEVSYRTNGGGLGSKSASAVSIGNYFFATNTAYVRGVPYTNLSSAQSAASSGDTIYVMPGNYTNNNLLKKGVNWFGHPGADLYYTDPGSGLGYGIFDDRTISGGYQGVINWLGTITYSTGIGGYSNGVFTTDGLGAVTYSTNIARIMGLFGTTNSSTDMFVYVKKLVFTSLFPIGVTEFTLNGNTIAAISVHDCSRVSVTVDEMVDPNFGVALPYGSDEFGVVTQIPATQGVYWRKGNLSIRCNFIHGFGGYTFKLEELTGVTNSNKFHYEGHLAVGDIFCNNNSTAKKAYFKVKQWIHSSVLADHVGGNGAFQFHGGFLNVETETVEDDLNNLTDEEPVVYSPSTANGFFSLTANKVTGRYRWVEVGSGTINLNVKEWEDAGLSTYGFHNNGATLHLHAGLARTTNAPGLKHESGITFVNQMRIHTAAGASTNNSPIFVAGPATTAAAPSGLVLRECWLTGPAIANVVNSTNTQFVRVQNVVANTNSSPAVTFTVGSMTVDGTVQ